VIIKVSTPVIKSARVMQAGGMFDVADAATSEREWNVDLPLAGREWSIGLVVGPSGSGKSTLARTLWPQVETENKWDPERSILDGFPQGMPLKEITGLLSSVGLGSAPSWLRPHHVLSTGEKFRADMALALTRDDDPVVVDEFTSVVDRQVGKVASYAVAKAVRRRGSRLVAVSCHEDVTEWLGPDWVMNMATQEFTWRSKRPRPPIHLEIGRVPKAAWRLFAPHHYLSGALPGGTIGSWGCWIDGEIVGFGYACKFPHPKVKDIVRIRRQVILPDWQGLGIGSAMEDAIATYYATQGFRFRSVTVHPGKIAYYTRSPNWAYVAHHPRRLQVGKQSKMGSHHLEPRQMSLRTFEWRGTKRPA
jgi:energy-coupling factor transporter ATP-binding protein EcfA2